MKTLLIGNGINIQYAKDGISNKDIILRAINNIKSGKLNKEIIIDDPNLLLSFLGICYRQVAEILEGAYEDVIVTSYDRAAYIKFLNDYSNSGSVRITDIGFEDYFFIMQLLFRKNKLVNPEAYFVKITFDRLFIDAIYNDGKVNEIYKEYPLKLKKFFNEFDTIFTTNYDRNIEYFTGRKVNYLHGAFHIRDDVYNPNSLRNYLTDAPLKKVEVDVRYSHLYSNSITTYSGNNKLFRIKQEGLANEALEKFAYGYANDENIRMTMNSFLNSNNQILINLAESIKRKAENMNLKFSDSYPIKEFEDIKGDISVVGLAPNNDVHIFEMINDNPNINRVEYYYYSPNQNKEVRSMLNNKKVVFKQVNNLWELYG